MDKQFTHTRLKHFVEKKGGQTVHPQTNAGQNEHDQDIAKQKHNKGTMSHCSKHNMDKTSHHTCHLDKTFLDSSSMHLKDR